MILVCEVCSEFIMWRQRTEAAGKVQRPCVLIVFCAQGGVWCHITSNRCRYSAQCWGCCPGKSKLSGAGSGRTTTEARAFCTSGQFHRYFWVERCRGTCVQVQPNLRIELLRCCNFHSSAPCADLGRDFVFVKIVFFFEIPRTCLARRLPKAKPRPAARLRAAPPGKGPGKLRRAARALFRWTAWSIPADPPSATAASFMTSLSR